MKKVLVTGADGFIGQHLTRKLIDKNYSVRAVVKKESNTEFYNADEIECRCADICHSELLKGICTDVDTVFHLAAIPRNDLNMTWDDFFQVNIQGTKNLLGEAEKAGVRKFVFISTVEAAGFGDGVSPRSESDAPKPVNNYGKSKLEAEKLVLSNHWAMECSVLRLPMIYGPGTFLIVPKLFGMVRKGFYPLIGDGSTLMEFCYVENAVDAIILTGQKKESAGELFYVSDLRSYSIREVVENIADAMNCKVRMICIPKWAAYSLGFCWECAARICPIPPIISKVSRKPFFSRETVYWTTQNVNTVSTEKIQKTLGFKPQITITEGCRLTAQWLKKQLWS